MVVTRVRMSTRPHIRIMAAEIMAAKEVAGDGTEKGEDQTDRQTDRVDNHKRLILLLTASKGSTKPPKQARNEFAPLWPFRIPAIFCLSFI